MYHTCLGGALFYLLLPEKCAFLRILLVIRSVCVIIPWWLCV